MSPQPFDPIGEYLAKGRKREAQILLDMSRAAMTPERFAAEQRRIDECAVPRGRGDKHGSGDPFKDAIQEMSIAGAVAKLVADNGSKRGATKAAINSVINVIDVWTRAKRAKSVNGKIRSKQFGEVERIYYKWKDHLHPNQLQEWTCKKGCDFPCRCWVSDAPVPDVAALNLFD